MCWLACHSATGAPDGSMTKDIRPASMTSNGAIATLPPAASTLAVASSTESTAREVFHIGGGPAAAHSGGGGGMGGARGAPGLAGEEGCPPALGRAPEGPP